QVRVVALGDILLADRRCGVLFAHGCSCRGHRESSEVWTPRAPVGFRTSYSRHATGGIVSRRADPPLGRRLQPVCLGIWSFGQSLIWYRGLPDGESGLLNLGEERLLVFSGLVVLFSLPHRAHCSSCP